MGRFIEALFAGSADGALLFAQNERSEGFLQFRLMRSSPRNAVIRLSVPDAPWSRRYFEKVANDLRDAGIEPAIEATGSSPTTRFLHVAFAGPTEEQIVEATEVAKVVARALGFHEADTYRVWSEGGVDLAVAKAWIEDHRPRK